MPVNVFHTSIRITKLIATRFNNKFAMIAENAPRKKAEILARPQT